LTVRWWWQLKKDETDLEREIKSDLELEEEDQREKGLPPEEARHAAKRAFGNEALIKEQSREAWGWLPFERLLQDVRYSFRQLARNPGFGAITVFTLALGIGSTTAIFSIFNATLLRPLAFEDPDRLALLYAAVPAVGYEGPGSVTDPDFAEWQQQNQVFDQIAAFRGKTANLTGSGEPERLAGATATASLFSVLGSAPELGRVFSADEQNAGHENVVLLSHKLWARRFALRRDILGKTIQLDGIPFTVLGVMPPQFEFPGEGDFWTPMVLTSDRSNAMDLVIARLKPNISLARAGEDVTIIQHRLAPQDRHEEVHFRFVFLKDIMGANVRPILKILFASVTALLLVGCFNVANLFLTRSTARHHEIAMRSAFGASRLRIIRQLLTESTLLAGFAAVLGLVLATVLGKMLAGLLPQSVPESGSLYHAVNSQIDWRVLVFSTGVALSTGVLFGLAPAISVSRANLLSSVKEWGATYTVETGSRRIRRGLIVGEFAITLVLLFAAGLLLKSFLRLLQVDPGFDPHNVAILNLELPATKYQEGAQMIAFHDALLTRIDSLPGVRAAGTIAFGLPLGGGGIQGDFTISGQPQPPDVASKLAVSAGYFSAMGVPLISGRWFNRQDSQHSQPVVIVSESFAKRFWPGKDALGQRINPGFRGTGWCSIVGIAGDVKQSGLASRAPLTIYLPYSQAPDFLENFMTIAVRGDANRLDLLAAVRSQLQAVDPDIPIFNANSMEDLVTKSIAQPRLNTFLFVIFAALALVLAAVGIYGVISYSVTQRQREIGIRMALGAERRSVTLMVVREGVRLAFLGIGAGLVAGFFVSRLMASFLFDVTPSDPATFASVSILSGAVALAACYLPARRASRIDPMAALRIE
jgi:putative ABC transport system permease protein